MGDKIERAARQQRWRRSKIRHWPYHPEVWTVAVIVAALSALYCVSPRDETATAINLYSAAFDDYNAKCSHIPAELNEWCSGYYLSLIKLRQAIMMVGASIKIGGNMKYQLENLDSCSVKVKEFMNANPHRANLGTDQQPIWSRYPHADFRRAWGYGRYTGEGHRPTPHPKPAKRDTKPWLI